ncbi:MAG: hypothetical protein DI537_46900, partial [Stutzerimonas stutzeri]
GTSTSTTATSQASSANASDFFNSLLEVTRPLERLEIDETLIPLQAFLVDAGIWETLTPKQKDEVQRGRYWLSAAIDAATRCYTAALLVEKLTASTAVATLEMAVNDKSAYAAAAGCLTPWDMYGSPECVVQDSGSQFLSHEYCAAVTDLGAELLFPPAGLPQMRARKERGFRTLNGLFSRLDGQTFENVVAKGDYNAEARATLDIEETEGPTEAVEQNFDGLLCERQALARKRSGERGWRSLHRDREIVSAVFKL